MTRADPRYFVGLSLGQSSQFTALAVLHRRRLLCDSPDKPPYAVSHLQRFPPGSSYAEVIQVVRALLQTEPLAGATLVVDRTGVGQAVLSLFQNGLRGQVRCQCYWIALSSGHDIEGVGGLGVLLPRKELVSTLQVLLQTRRLQIARSLTDAELLAAEMARCQVKVAAMGSVVDDPWRSGPQDDLILAVGVAAWVGEKLLRLPPRPQPVRYVV